MSTQVYIFLYEYSFGYIPKKRTAVSYVNCIFNILRNCQTDFHGAVLFYIPTSDTQGFQILHIFANICYFLVLFFIIIVILVDMNGFEFYFVFY